MENYTVTNEGIDISDLQDEYVRKHFIDWISQYTSDEDRIAYTDRMLRFIRRNPDCLDRMSWPEIRDRS